MASVFSYAIDPTHKLRLGDAGHGTGVHVPAASVADEQAAVSVLHHVGRVEVGVRRSEEITVFGSVGGSIAKELVALHPVGVELGAEEIGIVFIAPGLTLVLHQPGGGDAGEFGHGGEGDPCE